MLLPKSSEKSILQTTNVYIYLELSIKRWAKDNSYFRAFVEPSASDMLIMDEAPAKPPAWKPGTDMPGV